jgi:hypothetical protein
MAIPPTDIRILFTDYDIITYFLNLASCSEHFISIKHWFILKVANIRCFILIKCSEQEARFKKYVIMS